MVVATVRAWLQVGLKIYFVFDGMSSLLWAPWCVVDTLIVQGAYPELKFETLISRAAEKFIQPSLLFFRTSVASRSTPRFLRESRIIPPLCYSVCIAALEKLSDTSDNLEVHYADEEGDPFAVELAGRIGGYVVGMDSDFVVLNSEDTKAIYPLMRWHGLVARPKQISPLTTENSHLSVTQRREGRKRMQRMGNLVTELYHLWKPLWICRFHLHCTSHPSWPLISESLQVCFPSWELWSATTFRNTRLHPRAIFKTYFRE